MGIRCADHVTPLYPQKLALTSPTAGGRSVGIVRSRTKATEFFFSLFVCGPLVSINRNTQIFIIELDVARKTGQNSCPRDAEDALRNHLAASVNGVVFVLKNCETL